MPFENYLRLLCSTLLFPLVFMKSPLFSPSTVFQKPIPYISVPRHSVPLLVLVFSHPLSKTTFFFAYPCVPPTRSPTSSQRTQRSRWICPSLRCSGTTLPRKSDTAPTKYPDFLNLIAKPPSPISSIRQISISLRSRDLHVQIWFHLIRSDPPRFPIQSSPSTIRPFLELPQRGPTRTKRFHLIPRSA